MSTLALNTPVPNVTLEGTAGLKKTLEDFKGKTVVLYFYPKDRTPGCTMEAKAFRDAMPAFDELNTVIFGISRDPLESHEKFKAKHCLPFELLCDPESKLCDLFDVIKEKSLFGKKFKGIVRSTFLIDKNGILREQWRKVKISNHVEEVLEAVKALEQ